jgi:transcriptional regulator NrdR family protein
MEKILRILKSNGELEPFSPDKLRNSLRRAGASEERASEIIAEIESKMFDGVSTRVIFNKAFELLRKPLSKTNILYSQKNEGAAARYKLKKRYDGAGTNRSSV